MLPAGSKPQHSWHKASSQQVLAWLLASAGAPALQALGELWLWVALAHHTVADVGLGYQGDLGKALAMKMKELSP